MQEKSSGDIAISIADAVGIVGVVVALAFLFAEVAAWWVAALAALAVGFALFAVRARVH